MAPSLDAEAQGHTYGNCMASNLWEFSGKTCNLYQCTMTALRPRTGGNKTYIMVHRDRNSSEYPSDQEGGGPRSVSIYNGNNTKPDTVSAQEATVVGKKAQKQNSSGPSSDMRGVVTTDGRTGPVWRSHGPWTSLVPRAQPTWHTCPLSESVEECIIAQVWSSSWVPTPV